MVVATQKVWHTSTKGGTRKRERETLQAPKSNKDTEQLHIRGGGGEGGGERRR